MADEHPEVIREQIRETQESLTSKLSTLEDTLIWEGDQSEDLPPSGSQKTGYFHSGLMEVRLDLFVWQVLGQNC